MEDKASKENAKRTLSFNKELINRLYQGEEAVLNIHLGNILLGTSMCLLCNKN